jgi:WD40 repeat protein
MAQARLWGAMVWDRDSQDPPRRLVHADTRYVDVSPDGRFIATGSHHGREARIWDSQTGAMLHELPSEGQTYVVFSADGRMLVTGSDENRLWSVESGRRLRDLGGRGAVDFSRDGTLLAVEIGDGTIRLMNPVTGRDYALLEDPNQDRANNAKFSPDGTRLTVTTQEGAAIHVWNLRAIRAQLALIGLDWDLPSYAPAKMPQPLTLAE